MLLSQTGHNPGDHYSTAFKFIYLQTKRRKNKLNIKTTTTSCEDAAQLCFIALSCLRPATQKPPSFGRKTKCLCQMMCTHMWSSKSAFTASRKNVENHVYKPNMSLSKKEITATPVLFSAHPSFPECKLWLGIMPALIKIA